MTTVFAVLLATCTAEAGTTDCNCQDWTPVGVVNKRGYNFEYQSGFGKGCIEYRLRNAAGAESAQVVWRADGAPKSYEYLDVELQATGMYSPESWRSAVHLASETPELKSTYLGFGLNQDQYDATPDAYRVVRANTKSKPTLFETILRIIIGEGREGRVVSGVRASSSVSGENPPYKITYKLRSLDPDRTFTLVQAGMKPAAEGATVVWDASRSKEFTKVFGNLERKILSPEQPEVSITILADAFNIVQTRRLRMVNSSGRTVIGASCMTFVPATEPQAGDLR